RTHRPATVGSRRLSPARARAGSRSWPLAAPASRPAFPGRSPGLAGSNARQRRSRPGIAVSLSLASRTEQVPLEFELYLPHSWTDDPARRKEARIPDDLEFKTRTRSRSRCSSARSPTGCRSASCSPTRRTKVTSRAAISYGYRGPEASLSVGKRRAALRVRGADGKARQSGAVVVVQRTSSDLELYEESRCTVRGGGPMLPGVPRIALRVLSDSPTLWLADARCQDLPAAPEVCADPGNHLVLTRRGMFVQHVGGSA